MNKTFLTFFALVGIFLCGSIVGGVIAVRYVRSTVQKKAADQQLNSQQWVRITNRLNPTEEQREKIRAIVAAYMEEQAASRRINQAANEKLHEGIRAVLTPEQNAEYEKIRARQRENERLWQRWFKEQRAKHGESPLVAPAASQPETKAAPAKEGGGKSKTGKKRSAVETSGTSRATAGESTAPLP